MRTLILIAAALGLSAANTGSQEAVTYIDNQKVAAAFAKGMPLVEVDGYKIHASRRDADGLAEIHERDTDIVYVLGGTATLVTGGSVVEGASSAPEEIRGKSIANGESRRLAKGDVVVIPNGVPHLFRQVQAPFTYYVVKVRSQSGAAK